MIRYVKNMDAAMGAAMGAGAWPKFIIDRIVCKRLLP